MHISVDVTPDQIIEWFASYPEAERARLPVGPCTHDCPHNMTATVAWGPDVAHYELHTCDVKDGCDKNCRGWAAATGVVSEWKLLSPLV